LILISNNGKANLSAQKEAPRETTWFLEADAHPRRKKSGPEAPLEGTKKVNCLSSLNHF